MCNSIVFGTTGGPKTAIFTVFSVQILYSFLESARGPLITHGFIAGLKAKTTGGEISANKAMNESQRALVADKVANLGEGRSSNTASIEAVSQSILHNVQIKNNHPTNICKGSILIIDQIKDSIIGLSDIKGASLCTHTKPKKTQMVSNRFRNHFETVNAGSVTFALPHSTSTHC
ncbi:MAG: hypothetical protein KME67_10795 [Candidatus Thiodiazotropha sp. (ex Codakia orbicularis)]|nr:hypothetical protein [Candidatus Thiodiazotropha sp. (ex Codakia orbicularis)]